MGEKIAFIGLGAMGGPMAQNIIKKGTKNTWNTIGRHPLSLKIEIRKFNTSLLS